MLKETGCGLGSVLLALPEAVESPEDAERAGAPALLCGR